MPRPKRQKASAAAPSSKKKEKAVTIEAPGDGEAGGARTRAGAAAAAAAAAKPVTAADGQQDNPWTPVARKHWLKSGGRATRVKVKADVVKTELYDVLEASGFRYGSVLALENVQALEGYLWPGFGEESSNYHVLLMVLLINAKKREQLETWSKLFLSFYLFFPRGDREMANVFGGGFFHPFAISRHL